MPALPSLPTLDFSQLQVTRLPANKIEKHTSSSASSSPVTSVALSSISESVSAPLANMSLSSGQTSSSLSLKTSTSVPSSGEMIT